MRRLNGIDLLWVMGASAPLPRLHSTPAALSAFVSAALLVLSFNAPAKNNRWIDFVFQLNYFLFFF